MPPHEYTAPTLQLFVMDEDGENVSFIGALAVSAFVLLDTHAATASVFFGLAVVHAVVSLMVEPATNRAFAVPPDDADGV